MEVDSSVNLTFSLKYLSNFTRVAPLSDKVKLSIRREKGNKEESQAFSKEKRGDGRDRKGMRNRRRIK